MSGNQQDPDMMCEIFVVAPTTSSTDASLRAAGP
jgi:hypothetical protein